MLNYSAEYKHETPYKVPFVITLCLTDCTVTKNYGAIKLSIIYVVLIHKYGTKVDCSIQKKMSDEVNI